MRCGRRTRREGEARSSAIRSKAEPHTFFQSYLRPQLPGRLSTPLSTSSGSVGFWSQSGASGSDEEGEAARLHLSILVTGSLISATPLRTGSLLYSDLGLLLLKCENL